ncbi:MAG TPA: chromate transporter [Xanthobacteraceae bacterium]|jgi:chromate transporter|nr:chromate transporter [Xanthobacteraceae bacterium]
MKPNLPHDLEQGATTVPPRTVNPSLPELFLGFLKISTSGFGGVLVWSRRLVVQEKRWMSPEEFNEAYALCQFLPGPNIVNFSVVFGARFRGFPGAAVALVGLLAPPVAFMVVLGTLYQHYGTVPQLRGLLTGLSAGAAGVILSTSIQMAEPVFRRRINAGHFVAVAAFVGVGLFRLPLLWVLAALVPVSIAFAYWGRT